jgi:hypothetical protein
MIMMGPYEFYHQIETILNPVQCIYSMLVHPPGATEHKRHLVESNWWQTRIQYSM